MSRRGWIVLLVLLGIGGAIAIGILGTRNSESETDAVSALCSSLKSLDTAVTNLTSLPSSATKNDYENDVDAVESAWSQVKADAQDVQDASTGDLDSAWDSFESAVKDVPDDASVQDAVSDIGQAADTLVSTAKSTASEIDCSTSSSS